ncbi:MAG: SpoIIE family protein phosphatase [Acidobacteriota bacterium]
MNEMNVFREELWERKNRIGRVLRRGPVPGLLHLLKEVDAALERLDDGSFGLCDVCHEPIETDRLLANPLTCTCLGHLSEQEHRALEHDLDLVGQVQRHLLPDENLRLDGWQFGYHYRPFRLASGDYCDVFEEEGSVFLLLGDVAGKGVAASMLVANLHGLFRTLLSDGRDLRTAVQQANHIFCQSTIASHYATLVGVRAERSGALTMVNAGHCTPLIVREEGVEHIDSTGFPLGVFCDAEYQIHRSMLHPGDGLFLYTDGFSEAHDSLGEEYGSERLTALLRQSGHLSPRELIATSMKSLDSFRSETALFDDLTLIHLKRTV